MRCSFAAHLFVIMHSRTQINSFINDYLELFPGEHLRQLPVVEWLTRNKNEDLYSRKNFDGHITTSAFIIDPVAGEMLLLKHKTLGKWFQPGGHTEADETLVASALREAIEETGIPENELLYKKVSEGTEVPCDIDSHYIPANDKKAEAGHFHHDFRYLFLYTGKRDNTFNTHESTGMKWRSLDDLLSDPVFSGLVEKIRKVVAAI